MKKTKQNWWLLLGVGIVCFAGGLSVASDCGLLKLKGPHEMVRSFRSARKGRVRKTQLEGGEAWGI